VSGEKVDKLPLTKLLKLMYVNVNTLDAQFFQNKFFQNNRNAHRDLRENHHRLKSLLISNGIE